MDDIVNLSTLTKKAQTKWDELSISERLRNARKYKHIFTKLHLSTNPWDGAFSALSHDQQSILIKGELINLYNSLPFIEKERIKKGFNLSRTPNKWHRLPSIDKKRLLNGILREKVALNKQ